MVLAGGVILAGTGVPALAQEGDEQVDPQRFSRGAQAWQENCSRCHNLRSPDELQDYEWATSVDHMRVRANLPGQVAEDIKLFLQNSN
jgi:mono/diheme cytochrome c family protein